MLNTCLTRGLLLRVVDTDNVKRKNQRIYYSPVDLSRKFIPLLCDQVHENLAVERDSH